MTKETLLFQRLLDAQQLHVGDPELAVQYKDFQGR